MNFDFLGLGADKAQLIVAGALGGLVRWLTLRDHWVDGVVSILVGALSAMYIAPLAVPSLIPVLGNINVAPENVGGLSGFLIGIGGITVSGFFIDAWRLRRRMVKDAAGPGGGAEAMMIRRAAGEAGKRALRLLAAAGLVVSIGLVVFANRAQVPDWLWRLRVEQILERLS